MRSVAGSSARAESLTEPDALARAEPLGVREWGYLAKLEERIRAAMAILAAILAIL